MIIKVHLTNTSSLFSFTPCTLANVHFSVFRIQPVHEPHVHQTSVSDGFTDINGRAWNVIDLLRSL